MTTRAHDWDSTAVRSLVAAIRATATRRWRLREVSGGPPGAPVTRRLAELLAPIVDVTGGDECAVCLMPATQLENARRLAAMPNVEVVAFRDVLAPVSGRCTRHRTDVPSQGGRTAQTPLDALEYATAHPDREVVFFAAGTEAAAPANAMAVWRAHQLGTRNFSILVSHTTAPMAIAAALATPGDRPQAFLVAGHLGGIMGWADYESVAATYRVPIVVTGFEPVDMLEGVSLAVRQLEEGRYEVEHQHVRSVRRGGTPPARELVTKIFQVVDHRERGGTGPGATVARMSGFALRAEFAEYDAEQRFGLAPLPG